MKKAVTVVSYMLLFGVAFLIGCAGPATQTPQTRIDDRTGKAGVEAAAVGGAAEKPGTGTVAAAGGGEGTGGAKTAQTAEKPAEKVFVDKKGKFEVGRTPFGYVKREIKPAEKASSAPAAGRAEPVVPLVPQVKAPATPSGFSAGAAGPTSRTARQRRPDQLRF